MVIHLKHNNKERKIKVIYQENFNQKPFVLLSIPEHTLKNIFSDDVDKDNLEVLLLDGFKKDSKHEAS